MSSSLNSSLAERLNNQFEICRVGHREMQLVWQSYDLDFQQQIIAGCPSLFSKAVVFVAETVLRKQHTIISAINQVLAMPAYQAEVMRHAPDIARFKPKAHSVFLGYDFHINPNASKLIEINTNAGGAMLNALLLRASPTTNQFLKQAGLTQLQEPFQATDQNLEQRFFQMFMQEWQAERGLQPLQTIAIVDEQPQQQYLLPEFVLFKQLFRQQGLQTIICDPSELEFKHNALWHDKTRIDLVYNRHTDFAFETRPLQQLSAAYSASAVVVTPHPFAHALYADKRNLVLLSDSAALRDMGVDNTICATLDAGIARTHRVAAADAGALWAGRKHLFFKPAKGYGSKAAYRGDKLTTRVFQEILQGDYVAQVFVAPGLRQLQVNDANAVFKWDLRHYAYQNDIQLTAARLYQGQTTNFRSPGGGFAQVVPVPE